jgi:hypothetical protein
MKVLVFKSKRTGNCFAKPYKNSKTASRAMRGLMAKKKVTSAKSYSSMNTAIKAVKRCN